MAAAPLVADEATIVRMILAFGECQTQCRAIHTKVESARADLGANWTSTEAAPVFLAAVEQWMHGFGKVRKGLDMLNGTMQWYARHTTTTEDDNALYAAWAS